MGTAESVREEVDDGVTARLDRLVDVLEQYFHPSNGGRWTASLSRFMRNLMDFFSRRLMLDAALRDQQQTVPVSATARRPMSAHVQRRFVRALLRMAGRAQYSKDNGLMDTACGVPPPFHAFLSLLSPSFIFFSSITHTRAHTHTHTHARARAQGFFLVLLIWGLV
jgi:proteasome activator subunit 4